MVVAEIVRCETEMVVTEKVLLKSSCANSFAAMTVAESVLRKWSIGQLEKVFSRFAL